MNNKNISFIPLDGVTLLHETRYKAKFSKVLSIIIISLNVIFGLSTLLQMVQNHVI